MVLRTTRTDKVTGQHRRGRNKYVLLVSGDVIAQCLTATQIPALTSNDADPVAVLPLEALEILEAVPTPQDHLSYPRARENGRATDALVIDFATRLRETAAGIDQLAVAKVVPIRPCHGCGQGPLQVGERWHIGCQPDDEHTASERELRATLTAAFGNDITVKVYNHQYPDPGDPLPGWFTQRFPDQPTVWYWRPEPYGTCKRCPWPSHTVGPNGDPWHAYCWAVPRQRITAFEWREFDNWQARQHTAQCEVCIPGRHRCPGHPAKQPKPRRR